MNAPSLHEIAQMPISASTKAMREHYVPDWRKPIPEGVTEKQFFKVKLSASVSLSETFEYHDVEAWSEEEAEQIATDKAWDEIQSEHGIFAEIEVIDATVTKSGDSK